MRVLVCFLFALSIWGHDMWIEPTAFRAAAGQPVGLKLRVGQDWMGDPIPRHSSAIREFVAVDAAGRRTVMGREGSDPAGFVPSGPAVIGYWSAGSTVDLDAAKFNEYLREEGLERVLAERARRGESAKPARDIFSRCAKSLLSGADDQALGFPLELVAERNPAAAGPLPLRLTYAGKPLAGALVVAMLRGRAAEKITARTDAAGRVRLPLQDAGMWMVKAVHMVPSGADWASYWASLTFAKEGQ